jgi:alpha-1,6-mannosyltransferase
MIAAAVAAANRPEQPIGLLILGDGMDRARVARAARRYPNVQLMTPTRDRSYLAKLFASVDGLVHGSESETFGLVIAEALASGLPVVLPDRGACSELAPPSVREIYRSADVGSATAAILRLFARDPVALRAASLQAATEVRSDSQHYVELFDLYDRLIRDRHAESATAV